MDKEKEKEKRKKEKPSRRVRKKNENEEIKKKKEEKEREELSDFASHLAELEIDEDTNELLSYFDEDGYFEPPTEWFPPIKDLGDMLDGDKSGRIIVFNARKGMGKSFFIRYICYRMRKQIRTWFVFTKTKFNGFFQDECGICEKRIFDGFGMGVLREIMEKQEERRKEWQRGERSYEDFAIGIIFDDIGSEVISMRYSEDFSKIIYNCRHLHCLGLIGQQYIKFIGPGPRSNTDYPCMFRQSNQLEIDCIAENYYEFYPKKKFKLALNKYTKPMHLLDDDAQRVYRKDKQSGKLTPVVVPMILCRQMIKNQAVIAQVETMFRTYAPDPPPFITSGEDEWQVCREDPAEAYMKTVEAYEGRVSEYVLKSGKRANFNATYEKHMNGKSLFTTDGKHKQ